MRGAVAAGNAQTVAAGMAALTLGGNAVDAVVAATLMACVTEPLLTGLGGGGLAQRWWGRRGSEAVLRPCCVFFLTPLFRCFARLSNGACRLVNTMACRSTIVFR